MSYEGLGKSWQRKAFGDSDAMARPAPGKLTRTMGLPSGEGAALPEGTRGEMERSFGADFSAVRVHEDGAAEAMGAQALASGSDLHFAAGRYDPSGAAGKELLAHELAHTVQQAQGRVSAPAQGKGRGVDDPALEAEADAMAARAMRGERADGGAGAQRTAADAKPVVISSSASSTAGQPAQRRIDQEPLPYFEKYTQRGHLTDEARLAHVRRYAFEVPVNDKRQTFKDVVDEVKARAAIEGHKETVTRLWAGILDQLRIDDAETCEDELWTLGNFINGLYDVPGRLNGAAPTREGPSAVGEWRADIAEAHGGTKTDVEAIDPTENTYTLRTINLAGKQPTGDAYVMRDDEVVREETRNHVLFRDMTQNKYDVLFVILPQNPSAEVLRRVVRFRGKDYRIDLLGGSFTKEGKALGVEAGAVGVFSKLLGYEESVVYALRALFPQVIGGVKGTIAGRTYAIDTENDPKGEKLTFTLKDGKTKVQLNDGWGYIKSTLAAQMQENELTREKRQPQEASGNANYQMMHWFDNVKPEVIQELTAQGLAQWDGLNQEKAALEQQMKAPDADKLKLKRALEKNLEKRYSALTTGRPSMETAVAMPVAGDNVVLPAGSQRFADVGDKGVSLMRSPADKPNWRPVSGDNVETDSDRSKFLAGMEAIQYSLTGAQDGLLTFFKGMLGVIAEDNWPDAWKGVDLVVTGDDRKLYEQWHSEQDRKQTRSEQQDFSIQGNLVATQWFEKGSVVGVPNAAQKWTGGDYDGDEVGILLESRNPELTKQINEEYQEEQINPKLPKSFTDNPDGSRDNRLIAMQSSNVTGWSGIATKLRAMPPAYRSHVAEEMRAKNILAPKELEGLSDEDAMWMEIGKGIKVGTDGAKTAVPVKAYEDRAGEYQVKLTSLNVHQIPYEKALMKTIEAAGQPTLTNGAWRNIYFSCVNPHDSGHSAPMWGLPAATLASMLWALFPEEDRLSWWGHYVEWAQVERGFTPDPIWFWAPEPEPEPEPVQVQQPPPRGRGRHGRGGHGNRGHGGNRGRGGNRRRGGNRGGRAPHGDQPTG